jgi:uncharacterized protein (DUF362 family)
VADAIVAGQGDGPLAPQPLHLGLLFGGNNAAAVDWFGARLLAYDPQLIPIVREAFGQFRWPIATFKPQDIKVRGDWGVSKVNELVLKQQPVRSFIRLGGAMQQPRE